MASLSRCELSKYSRSLIRPRAVFYLGTFLTLLVSLSLAQVHLRFLTKDLVIETKKLQKQRADLLNRQKALSAEIEKLRNYDTIREYALNTLKLRECPPDHSSTEKLLASAVNRWRDDAASAAPVPAAPAPRGKSSPEKFFALLEDKMSLVSISMAHDK